MTKNKRKELKPYNLCRNPNMFEEADDIFDGFVRKADEPKKSRRRSSRGFLVETNQPMGQRVSLPEAKPLPHAVAESYGDEEITPDE